MDTVNSIVKAVRDLEPGNSARGLYRIINTTTLTNSSLTVEDDDYLYMYTFREFTFAITHITPLDKETFCNLKKSMLIASKLMRGLIESSNLRENIIRRQNLRTQCERIKCMIGSVPSLNAHSIFDAPSDSDTVSWTDTDSSDADDAAVPKTTTAVPKTGGGIPRNATAVPKTTTAVPKTVGGVPKTGGGVPRTAPGVPRNAAAVPRNVAAVPRTVGGVPKTVGGVPRTVGGVPRNVAAVPKTVGGVPRNAVAVPRNAAAVPKTVGGVPRNVAAVPRTAAAVRASHDAAARVNAYPEYAFGASGASEKLRTLHAAVLTYLALKDQNKHGMVVSNFPALLRLAGGYPDMYQEKKFVMDIRQKFCFMEKVGGKTGWYKFDVTVMDAYARICRVVLSQELKTIICSEAKFHKWHDISPLCGPPKDENVYLKCLRSLSKDVKQVKRRKV